MILIYTNPIFPQSIQSLFLIAFNSQYFPRAKKREFYVIQKLEINIRKIILHANFHAINQK